MTQIHATAIIDSDAEVDEKVVIGPYCYVGKNVKLGKDVQLLSHVVIEGHTSIGDGTRVFPFASIGYEPQDLKYDVKFVNNHCCFSRCGSGCRWFIYFL